MKRLSERTHIYILLEIKYGSLQADHSPEMLCREPECVKFCLHL
jgi:hypothetical protein